MELSKENIILSEMEDYEKNIVSFECVLVNVDYEKYFNVDLKNNDSYINIYVVYNYVNRAIERFEISMAIEKGYKSIEHDFTQREIEAFIMACDEIFQEEKKQTIYDNILNQFCSNENLTREELNKVAE